MIQFDRSPFFVNTELRQWEESNDRPRLAAISSFGFSGTNCHMVIGEHPADASREECDRPLYMIPLSAKTPESLLQRCRDLRQWLYSGNRFQLSDLSCTLQYGRSHFEFRLALLVRNADDLAKLLEQVEKGETDLYCVRGSSDPKYLDNSQLSHEANLWISEFNEVPWQDPVLFERALFRLADYYSRGATLDWERLSVNNGGRLISLPGYPFSKRRYWFTKAGATHANLHPLIHQLVESSEERKVYVSVLDDSLTCLRDHRMHGVSVLSGSAVLEMVRAAAALSGMLPGDVCRTSEVQWLRPVQLDHGPVEVRIELIRTDENCLFKINDVTANVLFCSGTVSNVVPGHRQDKLDRIDVQKMIAQMDTGISHAVWYQQFSSLGFSYGPSFQVLEWVRSNGTKAVSRFKPSDSLERGVEQCLLPPGLIDGAFQTVFAVMKKNIPGSKPGGVFLPFQLGNIEFTGSMKAAAFAVAEFIPPQVADNLFRFNVSILDDAGLILSEITDFVLKRVHSNGRPTIAVASEKFCYKPVWVRENATDQPGNGHGRRILILDAPASIEGSFEKHLQSVWTGPLTMYRTERGKRFERVGPGHFKLNYSEESDYNKLFANLEEFGMPDAIIQVCDFGNSPGNGRSASPESTIESIFFLSKALVKQRPTHPIQVIFVDPNPCAESAMWLSGISGFAHTMSIENPNFVYRIIEIDHTNPTSQSEMLQGLAKTLAVELGVK